ncbi:MAG: hypothetical protein HY912_16565 [Desulfomonile tiedjei]|uniref:Uncharacterized protein n=1 Tax=Desulfomonile tiedjei TaxID=2358 RepID=A0A9D6V5I3_9BACT|nr:hypothetical protein [Desulfomonile tiedjei]
MGELEKSLKAIERARRRKRELKSLIEVLFEEYKLVKTEIEMHKEQIEKLMSSKEYSAYLDTIEMDASLEFPYLSDQNPSHKK